MGQVQSISELVDQKKAGGKFQEALELLNTEKSMSQTLECKKSKMYLDALNDECIPIACAVVKRDEFLVVVSPEEISEEDSDPWEIFKENLEDAIKKKLEKHLRSDYLGELRSLLNEVMLHSVLKAKSEGEDEVQRTHVISANKSVIRIDFYLHIRKNETTEEDGGRKHKYVLLYYIQVGVVDMTKARLQVLIYELIRATDDMKLREAGEKLEERAEDTVHLFRAMQTLAKAARGEKVSSSERRRDKDEDENNDNDNNEDGDEEGETL